MKNIQTKFIASTAALLMFLGIAGVATAAGAGVSVTPANLTKNVGDTFVVSVGVRPSGDSVCAVEGTLDISGLTCESVTLASGITSQSAPTCSDRHFLIGLPGCVQTDRALFTVTVSAPMAGFAGIGISDVDVIGEGISVGNGSIGGVYTIKALQTTGATTGTGDGTSGSGSGSSAGGAVGGEVAAGTDGTVTATGSSSDELAGNGTSSEFDANGQTAATGGFFSRLNGVEWFLILLLVALAIYFGYRMSKKKGS